MITKLYTDNPDYRKLRELSQHIEDGDLIIYPTGMGYALGCNALKGSAVEHLYKLKHADLRKQPFAIMCASLADAANYVRIDQFAFTYMKQRQAEQVTYVLPPLNALPKLLKNRKEIGIRLSQHPVTTLLLEQLECPLITASLPIRRNEVEYLTHPELIEEAYGEDVYTVIDGGPALGGRTDVVRLFNKEVEILRQGEEGFPFLNL